MNKATESKSFFKGKHVLVTGGAGFVGTNLILALLKNGAKVRATIHHKKPQISDKRIEFIKANLINPIDCQKVVRGIDYCFMCSANTSGAAVIENSPLSHVTPNVIMNSLMLDSAYKAGVKKFLFISSNTVYPLTDYPVKESDINYNLYEKYFPVAWMKLFSEKLCEMYATKIRNPMLTIVIRPGNIYGPYDDFKWETSHVIPAQIRKVVERHDPIEVWGDGKDVKDLIYVEDLVEGLLLAMEKMEKFDPINLGNGKSISVIQALRKIIKADDYKGAKIAYNSSKPSMIPIRLINISKSKKLLGFNPKTNFDEGIKKTINWYRSTIDQKKLNS